MSMWKVAFQNKIKNIWIKKKKTFTSYDWLEALMDSHFPTSNAR